MSDKRRHRMRGAGQQKEALRGVGGAMRWFGGHKHKATPGTGFQSEPGYPARQHSSPGRMPLHAAERGCHVGETLRESVAGGRRWRHGPWEQVCACVLLVRRGRYCWWEEAGAEGGGTDSSDRARRARRRHVKTCRSTTLHARKVGKWVASSLDCLVEARCDRPKLLTCMEAARQQEVAVHLERRGLLLPGVQADQVSAICCCWHDRP